MVAFVCGVVPTLPGFIRAVGGKSVSIPKGASYLYSCVWPVGVVVSAVVYIALNSIKPHTYTPKSVIETGTPEESQSQVEDFDDKKL